MGFYGFHEYVPVAKKKENAKKTVEKLRKKNPNIAPIIIEGNQIAKKWWGKAWNKNLESYADFRNRIGRGRSYVKHGAVVDLQIKKGNIEALVQGSSSKPYEVEIQIDKFSSVKWKKVMELCNHKIETLEALIAGEFPKELEQVFKESETGLFPSPKEIHFSCSCPDSAIVCKHVAAVLYGVGARLDSDPILFFKLRDIDFEQLIKKSMEDKMQSMLKNADKKSERVIDDEEVFDLFGI